MKVTKHLLVFVGGFFLVVGFQNCGKVALEPVEFQSLHSVSAADATDPISNNDTESDDVTDEHPSVSQLVECQLKSPNTKIVLSDDLIGGSNASATRICMSENACLNLINDYAVTHDCTLSTGAVTSPSSNGIQCTQIFPGSKGTCKNAKLLSDDQVAALLTKLEK